MASFYWQAEIKKKLNQFRFQLLKSYKIKISVYPFDVSNYEETKNAFRNIFSKTKNVDVLVNNAGILKENLIGMISKKRYRSNNKHQLNRSNKLNATCE